MQNSDPAENLGKTLSTVFLACLGALFAYGFLLPLVFD
jgi:hypothetical protein